MKDFNIKFYFMCRNRDMTSEMTDFDFKGLVLLWHMPAGAFFSGKKSLFRKTSLVLMWCMPAGAFFSRKSHSPSPPRAPSGPSLGQGGKLTISGEVASSQVLRLRIKTSFLELIRGSRQSRGNDVRACCSEPPFPTHGGQDDGS